MSFVTKYVNIHSNLKLIYLFNYHFIYISFLLLVGFISLLLCGHTYARQTVALPQGAIRSFVFFWKILMTLVHSYDEIKKPETVKFVSGWVEIKSTLISIKALKIVNI